MCSVGGKPTEVEVRNLVGPFFSGPFARFKGVQPCFSTSKCAPAVIGPVWAAFEQKL